MRFPFYKKNHIVNHDYNPEWDYELIEKNHFNSDRTFFEEIIRTAEKVSKDLQEDGRVGFELFFVVKNNLDSGESVGMYISGTASSPVIAIDPYSLKEASVEHGLNLQDQVKATIAHEIAHSIEESWELCSDEELAEDFAMGYVETGVFDWEMINSSGLEIEC